MSDKVPTSRYVETAERQIQDLLGELEAVMADRDSLRTALELIRDFDDRAYDINPRTLQAVARQALTSSEKEAE